MRPAALLFDMDGLLLDTERVAQAAFRSACKGLGIAPSEADAVFLTLVGSSGAVTRARVAEWLAPDVDLPAFHADWDREFSGLLATGVPRKPGVAVVIADLAAAGYPMAVVTSTRGDPARRHLSHAGLLAHFTHVTGGDEVSANKPDPAPYAETAVRLGVVPTACVAFEDSDRGIASAVAAGCRSVQIPDLRSPEVPLPDLGQHVAADLRAAVAHLGLLN